MKMKCIIVDDEPLALDVLENFIKRMPDLELVARCDNAMQALQTLQQQSVDLMFSDIEMPEFNGLDLLKSLPNKPLTIFTTAHPEYALQGYELDIVDYLLKPIAFERFVKSVNKARELSIKFHRTEQHTLQSIIFLSQVHNDLSLYIRLRFKDPMANYMV